MFILNVNGKKHYSKNTLCAEGAFFLLQGRTDDITGLSLRPLVGGPVSFYDTDASHSNWSQNPDITATGFVTWQVPSGGVLISNKLNYTVNANTTVDGLYLLKAGFSKLIAATLFPSPINLVTTDIVTAQYTFQGSVA